MEEQSGASPAMAAAARVTLVISARERFRVAAESLQSVLANTAQPYELIHVDAGSPKRVSTQIARLCDRPGIRHLRMEHHLSPNQARNIGWRAAETPYVVFLDNDVIVSPGWLQALVACADETGADAVAPLLCRGLSVHTEIHQAGGRFTEDVRHFLVGPTEERRIDEQPVEQGRKVAEVSLARGETQGMTFHCALVRRDALERMGGLDERLLAALESVDLSLLIRQGGGRIVFEPTAIVTCLFPSRARRLRLRDWPFFVLRWSPQWQRRSLEHFRRKWQLPDDPGFREREAKPSWRHEEGLARPFLRAIPLLGRSRAVQRYGTAILVRLLGLWGWVLVANHDRRRMYGA